MKRVWIDYDETYPDFSMREEHRVWHGYSEEYTKSHIFEVSDEFFEEYLAVLTAYVDMQDKLKAICGYED